MKKGIKKISLFLVLAALGVGTSVSLFATAGNNAVQTDAAVASGDIRISVVRPSWWEKFESVDQYQPLRIANAEADLTNNVVANITYITSASWAGDTYYAAGGGFTEYSTNGLLFYDLPLATISGKFFDLARLSTATPESAIVRNHTAVELFSATMLHQVWRIWNDGAGIYRPTGDTAESRSISNPTLAAMMYGYLSCSSNTHNGYPAYPALNAHFNLSGREYNDTTDILPYDFDSADDYASGTRDSTNITLSSKVAMMEYMYNQSVPDANNIGYFDNKSTVAIIVGIAIIGLSGLAGLYFLKRKRI